MTIVWILLGIVVAVALLLLIFAKVVENFAFGKREEGNPYLRYFTAEDFEGLQAKPVKFPNAEGDTLRGNLYFKGNIEDKKALLVFVHGMGGGHLSYTTELNFFAEQGYLVLAYDNTGTMASEGKSLKSMTHSISDLRSALRFVKENNLTNSLPILLVGHSWGAYTVCRVLQYAPEVKGVVAFSAPENQTQLFCDQVKQQAGLSVPFLKPFFAFWERLGVDKKATQNTSAALLQTDVPVLLFHGEADPVVPLSNAVVSNPVLSQKDNIKIEVYPDKQHNVYATREAEQYIADSFGKLTALLKEKKTDEAKALSESLDFCKMCEEDAEVMGRTADFLKACLEK